LAADQRTRLFAIPTDRAEMARYYVLGAEDLELVRSKRRAVNRLGFAVQLVWVAGSRDHRAFED
jgi:hypothetical protein